MNEESRKQWIDRYVEAYNSFDIEGMMTALHPQFRFRNYSGGQENANAQGAEAFREMAERGAALFASRRQRIVRLLMHADRAEADIDYEAVLAQDMPGGPKAGEALRLSGRTVFRFRDGLISEIEDYS